MFSRLFELISVSVVKYQRIFFGFVLITFISLLVLEGRHKYHFSSINFSKKRHSKHGTLSPSDAKSSFDDYPQTPTRNTTAAHVGSALQSHHHKGGHIVLDPLQRITQSDDRRHPDIEWNVYREKSEYDVAKHWMPSAGQRKALAHHHAKYHLDFEGEDVLVFIHIPKTSGKTFNSHLVLDMDVPKQIRCKCRTLDKPHGCKCLNSDGYIWLFSRLTTAWPCGVHPSWSDLSRDCLNRAMDRKEGRNRKRKFTMVTMLRSPYTRYISEWHNVQQDGQWKPFQNLRCYPLSREEYCYDDNWKGVTLDQFLGCPSNPANNRQVRMLADLHMANCSQIFEWLRAPQTTEDVEDVSKRYQYVINNPLLRSAIHNLKRLPFFGLEEHQKESEYLFTITFGYKFKPHFEQAKTFSEQVVISSKQRERILDLNRLDLVLYRYARELFFKRLHENIQRKHLFLVDNLEFTTEATVPLGNMAHQ